MKGDKRMYKIGMTGVLLIALGACNMERPIETRIKENYNPQNEMFRLLGTKRSFSQNETFFFSHPYPPTLPFST